MTSLPFPDRRSAGRELASLLERYRGSPALLVLALPRGGVPVAFEVAASLQAPLDVFLVRKLGVPGHEELAFGAIASGGIRVINQALVAEIGIPKHVIEQVSWREREELESRDRLFRAGLPPLALAQREVVLVDDGLATGATMLAAARAARAAGAVRVIVAVPVAAREAVRLMWTEANDVVCAAVPEDFRAVGQWYDDFRQTANLEVQELLNEHHRTFATYPAGRPER